MLSITGCCRTLNLQGFVTWVWWLQTAWYLSHKHLSCMAFEDQINPAERGYQCLCGPVWRKATAMFVFPEQQCGPRRLGQKQRETENREKVKRLSVSRNTLSCHLFPIGKVVRHSIAGNTDVSPKQEKAIEEGCMWLQSFINVWGDKTDIYEANE